MQLLQPAKLRLFVAIELDAAARSGAAALSAAVQAQGMPCRFVPPDKFHVTLAFLGAVRSEREADVAAVLDRVALGFAPFRIVLDTVGAFPSPARARVIWLGSHKTEPAFTLLVEALQRGFEQLGFEFPRRRPEAHVTLCRCDGVRIAPPVRTKKTSLVVDQLVLFASRTLPGGAVYTVRHRAPLGT